MIMSHRCRPSAPPTINLPRGTTSIRRATSQTDAPGAKASSLFLLRALSPRRSGPDTTSTRLIASSVPPVQVTDQPSLHKAAPLVRASEWNLLIAREQRLDHVVVAPEGKRRRNNVWIPRAAHAPVARASQIWKSHCNCSSQSQQLIYRGRIAAACCGRGIGSTLGVCNP
jgi:hypothetical protein